MSKKDIKLLRSSLLVVIVLSFISCKKKDKFKDDTAFLIGKWKWEYSIHEYNFCDIFLDNKDSIAAVTDPIKYEMEFVKKGVLKFYKDGLESDSHFTQIGTVIPGGGSQGEGTIVELISEASGKETTFVFSWDGYFLRHGHFPFVADSQCELYSSFFVKE